MKTISKIGLSGTEYSIAVSCEYDGARFHIWLNPKTLKPNGDQTLYKNSIPERGEPGSFDTRKLDQNGATGRIIVPAMLAKAAKLKGAHDAKMKMERWHQEAGWEDANREEAVRKAAPALLAALKSLAESAQITVSAFDGEDLAAPRTLANFWDAIEKARKAIKSTEVVS